MSAHKVITIPNSVLMEEARRLLEQGIEVKIKAKGKSMSPNIKDGKDIIVLESTSKLEPRRGRIALACLPSGHYVVHRIKALDGEKVRLKGDGNLFQIEECDSKDIMGIVSHLERKGKSIDCLSDSAIKRAKMRTALYRCPLYLRWCLGSLKRKILK